MSSANPRSILIIDDDAISREVMRVTLEMHGYSVDTAEDGEAALKFLAEMAQHGTVMSGTSLPATILMDAQMPGLSGVELITALRSLSEARILAISASEPGKAIRAAADGFLLKPVPVESVAELLASAATHAPCRRPAAPDLPDLDLPDLGTPDLEPVVDPIVLGKLQAMMPAASVRDIYSATASDMKKRLAVLKAAMEADNAPEVARIAHSIKGGCAMVGLTGARNAAARMEISNLPVTWQDDLAQLHFALQGLEGMLASDFPA